MNDADRDRMDRAARLYKLPKAELIRRIRAQGTLVWTAHPLERWSKQDLVTKLAEYEEKYR